LTTEIIQKRYSFFQAAEGLVFTLKNMSEFFVPYYVILIDGPRISEYRIWGTVIFYGR